MATANYQFHAAITKDGQVVAQYSRRLGKTDDGLLYLGEDSRLSKAQLKEAFSHTLLLASLTSDDKPGMVEQPQQTGFVILPSLDNPYWDLIPVSGEMRLVSEGVIASLDYDSANVMTIEEDSGQ